MSDWFKPTAWETERAEALRVMLFEASLLSPASMNCKCAFVRAGAPDKKTAGDRTVLTKALACAENGLRVEVKAAFHEGYPLTEWTTRVTNEGDAPSPIIENLLALDARLPLDPAKPLILHSQKGSYAERDDYRPEERRIRVGERVSIAPQGGRSTNLAFPYFCLTNGDIGCNLAVGWPGQWWAEISRVSKTEARVRVGQQNTHFSLAPGESARTPRVAVQLWRDALGERRWEIRGKNIFRRWMRECNMPKIGGKVPERFLAACSSHQYIEMTQADEASQKLFIERYAQEQIPLDAWWMDAGWFGLGENENWVSVGTWDIDKLRFPEGFRPISERARERGMGTLAWFEVERASVNCETWRDHPEWLLAPGKRMGYTYDFPEDCLYLFNFGNAQACDWMIEKVDALICREGLTAYRQDFNMDPLPNWQAADAPDRVGLTENHYIEGLLRYWDTLRARHPDMLLDACSSGGRRNDIEVLKRCVPLIRSDDLFPPVDEQFHMMGMSSWIPFHGTGSLIGTTTLSCAPGTRDPGVPFSPYTFRSCMSPALNLCWDMRDESLPYKEIRRLINQWLEAAPNYAGDYYPLTEMSMADDVWAAWQFDRAEDGRGLVQAFRRKDSPYQTARLRLMGLTKSAEYEFRDADTGESRVYAGEELMSAGLNVELSETETSALLLYRRIEGRDGGSGA